MWILDTFFSAVFHATNHHKVSFDLKFNSDSFHGYFDPFFKNLGSGQQPWKFLTPMGGQIFKFIFLPFWLQIQFPLEKVSMQTIFLF